MKTFNPNGRPAPVLNRARVLRMAHILHKHSPEFSWRDCVAHAWYLERFRKALNEGVVEFTFFKKDGSYRSAKGTTNLVLIPNDKWPKGEEQSQSQRQCQCINYFDFDRNDWRSFQIWQFASNFRIWRLTEVTALPTVSKRTKPSPNTPTVSKRAKKS